MKPPASVRVGFVRRAVGLTGEVEVEQLGDNPRRFEPGSVVRAAGSEVRVERAHSTGGSAWRLKLVGIDGRDAADRLRGQYLEVPAAELEELPEGQYYQWQLIGLQVYDTGGRKLGRLAEVLEYPANDVYQVEGQAGEVLVPALRDVVREVDLESGRMVVDLPAEEEVR
ncbi:MAG: rRNA processing protein RimM [Chloroflexota bacterium]|jgi:16S rRNA processing protein RimM|nr:rRNA processing protein RimM [Chloroflexota bacterium]